MPTINLKIAAIAALLVAFIAFAMHYDHLKEKVAKQEIEIEQYAKNAESAARQVKLADEARNDYLTKLTEAENEISDLRTRVDSGVIKLRPNAKCPKVPAASTDTAGAIAAAPELTEDARQGYLDHRRDENKVNALLDLCVQTLKNDRAQNEK